MDDPPSDDGRLRFRYDFRRNVTPKRASPLAPCPPLPKSSGAKQGSSSAPVNCSFVGELVVSKQEPSPASGQIPRRHPSRVRVSAVRNLPSKRKREKEACREGDEVSPSHNPATDGSKNAAARQKVREALSLFESIYKTILMDTSAETRTSTAPDMQAFKIFNERSKEMSGERHVGCVPGIEVGDEFNLRVELCIVGLHRQHRLAIDFIDKDSKIVGVSLVYSRLYADGMGGSDDFEYSSFGDLKIGGNLALKNSMDTCTPVRVIHGFRGFQSGSSRETKAKKHIVTYIYDGVFLVDKYRRRKGSDGKYVCVFQFKRIPGQSPLVMKRFKTLNILKDVSIDYNKHLIVKDISHGEEKIPIPVVNTIDDEHPKPFKYTTKMIYPPQHTPPPPRGCGCIGGCSDSETCACAVKNGGEIPFNKNGAIVEAKPLVYECGPSCMCPLSCHNRVSQHGIKFRLEVFKTESRGWGVRSRDPIPSGSFICEYAGEILDDKEADKRTNDEYLFDIGNNYYDEALWDGLKTSIPDLEKSASCEDEEVGFAVDALEYGNVGRFVNHSCTPNLYAQNLLHDHDNKMMPHVALFAAEDITPMQELTYDYNYAIDQVRDPDGNIKQKNCYCGTLECTGRLY